MFNIFNLLKNIFANPSLNMKAKLRLLKSTHQSLLTLDQKDFPDSEDGFGSNSKDCTTVTSITEILKLMTKN